MRSMANNSMRDWLFMSRIVMLLPSVSLHAMDLTVASKLVIPVYTTASSNASVFFNRVFLHDFLLLSTSSCILKFEMEETETQDRDII